MPTTNGAASTEQNVKSPKTRRVVVIDDDPTGGQTVAGVPVVTRWETDDLRWLLTRDRAMGFVLTNSRSLTAEHATAVNTEIVRRCLELGEALHIDVSFISRSDSTLRGHFAVEVGTISAELRRAGRPAGVVLVVPAFFEAGRITYDDVHYVRSDEADVPVAETAYAADPAFGFAESNLIDWVRARLGESQVRVESLGLSEIRQDGAAGVARRLRALGSGADGHPETPPVMVVNATVASDYAVVAAGVAQCEAAGLVVLTRSGPSYLSARLGEPLPSALEEIATTVGTASHGLVVVGSHVPLSTAQLEHAVRSTGISRIELDVPTVLGGDRETHLSALVRSVTEELAHGDVALATSRGLHRSTDVAASLDVAEAVSSAIDEVVTRIIADAPPAWIVAKGGITSANMVTKVLELRRGWIVGQVFDGQLPLWRDDDPQAAKPLCVIFPGNVGTEETLTNVVRKLNSTALN